MEFVDAVGEPRGNLRSEQRSDGPEPERRYGRRGTRPSAWVVSASGLYQLPLGFSVSGAFTGRQGFPQQYLVRIVPHDTVGNPILVLTSPVGTYRLPNVYELDLRLANTFTIGPVSVTPSFNVFNATNANTVLAAAA